jgi:hypothetical protein
MPVAPETIRRAERMFMRMKRRAREAGAAAAEGVVVEVIGGEGALTPTTRWEPLTNGDPDFPELLFDGNGDVLMTEVPL